VPTTPSTDSGSLIALPLTTERYKTTGVLRVLPNQLGKNAVLEAELAVRELARTGVREWRQDPALRPTALAALGSSPAPDIQPVKAVFEDLRRQVEQLCVLGAQQQRPVPGQALALYCAQNLAFVAEYTLRGLARVVERDPGRGEGRTAELFAAMAEDAALWEAFEGMVRSLPSRVQTATYAPTAHAVLHRTRSHGRAQALDEVRVVRRTAWFPTSYLRLASG
jgi:hypothetical protein